MNRKLLSLGMACIGLIFAACSNNDDDFTPQPGEGNGNGAVVAISLKNVSTRVNAPDEDGVGDENTISKLCFYVFKTGGELVQTNSFTNQSTYKFVINVENAADLMGMHFLVGVNQPMLGGIPTDQSAFEFVKSHLSDEITFESFEKDKPLIGNTTMQPGVFPMSGSALHQNITAPTSSNESPVTNLAIEVTRLVSKVESPQPNPSGVEVNVLTEDLEKLFDQGVTDADFTFNGFVLINGLDKSDAFYTWMSDDDWSTWSRQGKKYLTSTFDSFGNYLAVYAGTPYDDMFITDTPVSYVFENQPEDDPNEPVLYFNKNTVNSFIIKGELKCIGGADDGKTAVRYWRANLIPDDNHRLFRNTIYRLTIDGVNTIGHGTPEDAENEVVPKSGNASVNVSIRVARWKVKTTNTIL